MHKRFSWTAAALLSTLAPAALGAQQPPAQPAPPACSGPEYRQFDFWLGEWEVKLPNGKVAGTNSIKSILGGCALQESWQGSGNINGHSYNIYDATAKSWHQTWVDNAGSLLDLNGGLQDGKMVLSGDSKDEKGTTVKNRITWTRIDADHVRQLWETSSDGKTWAVSFDGMYTRKASS